MMPNEQIAAGNSRCAFRFSTVWEIRSFPAPSRRSFQRLCLSLDVILQYEP